jgi:ribosomal protein S18 acetylase RimI-like enzyme
MSATPVRTALLSEWGPACRLIFQHLPPEDRRQREALCLDLLQRRELHPDGLFVVPGADGPRGAMLCLPVPGAAGLLWLPGTQTPHPQTAAMLVNHAVGWLRQQGVKLIQCLLIAEEEPLAEPLLHCGFQRITDLWYLRHEYATPVRYLDTSARLSFVSFADVSRRIFEDTLQRTYDGTLDCPELNGVRTIEEVIAGHQAQGRFDPGRWWLALAAEQPVGILLMSELPESGDWEVSYMGVVPEARGRGHGKEILLKALTEAWAAGVRRVALCVDSRNRPAAELYRRVGFESYDRRAVYLAIASRDDRA